MKIIKKLAAVVAVGLCLSLAVSGCSKEKGFMGNTEEAELGEGDVFAVISIQNYGDITVKLFPKAAPKAVAQFIKLAEKNYYDHRTIHRVVKDKLIQGGSLTGTGFDGNVAKEEYFAQETSSYMCHYYGALCMAKSADGNYAQFYIVNNNTPAKIDELVEKLRGQLDDEEVGGKMVESDKKYYRDYCSKLSNMPKEVKERYAQVGGLYDLDGNDTVFGQVVKGQDVLQKLNQVETVNGNNSDDKQNIASKPIDEIVIEKVEVIRIAPAATTTSGKPEKTRKPAHQTTEKVVVDGGEATSAATASAATAEPNTSAPTVTAGTAATTAPAA